MLVALRPRAHLGVAELALSGLDPSAELLRHRLHAVADAEHRDAGFEGRQRGLSGRFLVGRHVAAERMMPFAPKPRTKSSETSCGGSRGRPWLRTRRAMSCVYCAPKSRIRIFSCIIQPGSSAPPDDLHVVHVRSRMPAAVISTNCVRVRSSSTVAQPV